MALKDSPLSKQRALGLTQLNYRLKNTHTKTKPTFKNFIVAVINEPTI